MFPIPLDHQSENPSMLRSTCVLMIVAGCLFLAAGCTSQAEKQMGAEAPAPWPELETFMGEPMMAIGYPQEMGDWNGVKAALSSPNFDTALTTFEQSALPSDYSDKQPQKDATVKAFRDAVAAAKSGTLDDMKAKLDVAQKSLPALRGE
jgi:hypothetical protein